MIAGTLAVLDEPADEPLANHHDSGFRAVHVKETQKTFEDSVVQRGEIAGRVPDTRKEIALAGHRIETDTTDTTRKEATTWVADVAGAGWICAESTFPTDEEFKPAWPYSAFETRTGREIRKVKVDPGAFVQAQEDAGRDTKVEYVGRTEGEDSTSIEWGKGATQSRATSADVGVALTTFWDGEFVRVIVYASGYIAVWEPEEWPASAFARFVTEEVLPAAYISEDHEESDQATLDDVAEDDTDDECRVCGRDVDHVVDGKCAVCRDKESEDAEAEAYERLETVTMSDGGEDDGE